MGRLLYDMIFLIDVKIVRTSQAFGELLTHLEWLSHPHGRSRGMLVAADGFYLVIWEDGHAALGREALWATRGSAELLRDFFRMSDWESALRSAAEAFRVVPLRTLGVGAFGRVFLVRDSFNEEWALKVRLLKNASEHNAFFKEHAALVSYSKLAVPTPRSVSELHQGEQWAAFMMQPIGAPILASECDQFFSMAYDALHKLHQFGISHGDPRPPNFLQLTEVNRHSDRLVDDRPLTRSPKSPVGRCAWVRALACLTRVQGEGFWTDVLDSVSPCPREWLQRDVLSFVAYFFALDHDSITQHYPHVKDLFRGYPTTRPVVEEIRSAFRGGQ